MEHDINFSKANRLLQMQHLTWRSRRRSMRKFTTQRKKTKGNKGESVPAASESVVAVKSAYEKAKQDVDTAKLAITMAMEGAKAFEFYGNLLSGETRQPWETIVQAK
jgi:hypothetical protein